MVIPTAVGGVGGVRICGTSSGREAGVGGSGGDWIDP